MQVAHTKEIKVESGGGATIISICLQVRIGSRTASRIRFFPFRPFRKNGDVVELRPRALRRFLDLQFESIFLRLRSLAPGFISGRRVLEVGSGNRPWSALYKDARSVESVDPAFPADFRSLDEVPEGERFDTALLIEVLEHVRSPEQLLAGIGRRLGPEGTLIATVPFNARVHGAPDDYWRWTDRGLEILFDGAGWTRVSIEPRGGALSSLCAKWVFFWISRAFAFPWFFATLPIAILTAPVAALIGHLALRLEVAFAEERDPLGWLVIARGFDQRTERSPANS